MASIAKFNGRIILKHDSGANWAKATNFIPLKGEIIIYDDIDRIKIGDGATKVNALPFLSTPIRHGTLSTIGTIIPAEGEIIKVDDTGGLKIGDGTKTVNALPYIWNGVASTASESKLYLIGANTYNNANAQTFSDAEVYTWGGELNATSVCVAENVKLTYDNTVQSLKFVFE